MFELSVRLAVFGIAICVGIAFLTLFMPYAFKAVPWYVSYGGISVGVGILTFAPLILFFSPSPTSNGPLSSELKAPLSVPLNSAPSFSVRQSLSTDNDDAPLIWDGQLGHTYSSYANGTIHTHAVQISARNGSNHEIQLEDAYIVSGETGEKIPLEVGAAVAEWISAPEANPIPPNATVTLRAEFNAPAGLAASDFFNTWKIFHLTAKYDGNVHRKIIDEKTVAAIYSSFRPNPIGPRVTKRQ